jgi:protein TonB
MAVLSQPRSKTNLQIGPVLSRVEPLYPLEAVHQHLEGTVKLHVIVGLTGAVDRVELKNGPILLANAARIAVQQWRYKPTLLRNVPVESEEDVTVVFRLSRPANSGR